MIYFTLPEEADMLIVKRRAEREAEQRIIANAQVKKARSNNTADFELVAGKFREAVMKIRAAMKTTDTQYNYDTFFGGYEQCDMLLRDPAYHSCSEAQFAYQLLLGADSWLKHEADKLGENYVPPEHFYKAWLLNNPPIDLRGLNV